jgi:hypothetical protein
VNFLFAVRSQYGAAGQEQLARSGAGAGEAAWPKVVRYPQGVSQLLCDLYAFFSPSGEVLSPFLRRHFYASPIVLSTNSTLEFTMSFLSVLTIPATSASYRGHAQTFVDQQPAAFVRTTRRFELINVVVASKDAWHARKVLLACPDTAIVRCLPMHKDPRVKLEIRFPAGQGDTVINRILSCLPHGEFGGILAQRQPMPMLLDTHCSK